MKIKQLLRTTHLPAKIFYYKLLKIKRPLVVLLYVTDRCNLSCQYCKGHWSARKIIDYTTAELLKIIDECAELGACYFNIHGGEIFLRDDTELLVRYLKKKGMFVSIVTNGILLPERMHIAKLADGICISLDGKEENHDFVRGKGSYRAAMEAITVAKEHQIKFAVHAAITQKNKNDILHLATMAKEIGYLQQFSLPLKPFTENLSHLHLTDEEIKTAVSEIISLKQQGYPIYTSERVLKNALNWPLKYEHPYVMKEEFANYDNLIPCHYGKLKLSIDANGFAFPCSSLNQHFQALNVKEVGVKRAYEHILKHNRCEACYYLTQNDWNLLLGANLGQYFNQAVTQIKQIFGNFGRM
ncbi:MAG: radical SAM protein [Oligoflexia bacterium]|nr:radical SAM protein [Oligoflexia bacterium]